MFGDYVYHSAFAEDVPSIAAEGLLPGQPGHWGGDLGASSYGKLFFADSVEDALYYGLIVFREKLINFDYCSLPVVMRVKPSSIPELTRSRESGSKESWTKSKTGVPPEEIEILWHGTWRPVKSSQMESDYYYKRLDDDGYEDWEGEHFDTAAKAAEDVSSLYL